MNSIQTKHLTKTYGKARGIQDVNLEIKKGEVFGFIGPNGAGKSTTIKCIMNLINKNKGEIAINEKELEKASVKEKEYIGYLPSEIHLYDDLSVAKMLRYSASFYKKDCTKRIEYLVKELEIDVKKKIDELSLGNLKKVGIVLALMHEPEILILDEATSGLDPLMQEKFYQLLAKEKEKGTTIFFSSHILSEIKRICDRVAIIKEGKVIKVQDVESFTNSNISNVILTLETSQETEKIKQEIKGKITSEKENTIQFMFSEDINTLLKVLQKYSIKKLWIEEPSIEEIFMEYYKEEE